MGLERCGGRHAALGAPALGSEGRPAIGIMMCSLPAAGLAYILGNEEVQHALFDEDEEE